MPLIWLIDAHKLFLGWLPQGESRLMSYHQGTVHECGMSGQLAQSPQSCVHQSVVGLL